MSSHSEHSTIQLNSIESGIESNAHTHCQRERETRSCSLLFSKANQCLSIYTPKRTQNVKSIVNIIHLTFSPSSDGVYNGTTTLTTWWHSISIELKVTIRLLLIEFILHPVRCRTHVCALRVRCAGEASIRDEINRSGSSEWNHIRLRRRRHAQVVQRIHSEVFNKHLSWRNWICRQTFQTSLHRHHPICCRRHYRREYLWITYISITRKHHSRWHNFVQ